MTIKNHLLDVAEKQILSGGSPMPVRRCLVIHFTAGASGTSSLEFWRTPAAKGASAHIIIERDGTIIQVRPFDRTCGHAGKSTWFDPAAKVLRHNINDCSIGIELANAGNDPDALKWARKQPGFSSQILTHRNGGKACEWESYPQAQLDACLALAQALCVTYNLDDITGHDCIAPDRKDDPGPAFPMQAFREACGFQGLPTIQTR